jgi:hypothetical protein
MASNSTPDFGRVLGVSPDEACLGYVYAYRRRCRNTIDSNGRRQIGECLRQGTECLERGQEPPGWILHRIAALGLCWSHQYQIGNLLMQWQNKVKEYREENPSVNEPARTRSGAIYEAPQGRAQTACTSCPAYWRCANHLQAYDPAQSVAPRPVRQDPEDTTEPPVPELQVRSSPAPTPTNDQLMSELPYASTMDLGKPLHPLRMPKPVEGECCICLVSLHDKVGTESAGQPRNLCTIDGLPDGYDPAQWLWCKGHCGTNYHRSCILSWLKRFHDPACRTCPTCRENWVH